jgi:hypothetical protein
MNERIKELSNEAHKHALDVYRQWNGNGTFDGVPSIRNLYEEKFAQLLVQECINKMEQSFAGSIGTDDQKTVWGESANSFKAWNSAIKFSRDEIKRHFGVES